MVMRSICKSPRSAMALQGPFVVVADSPAPDVVEALRAAGAFPIIETNWADAAGALASVDAGSRGARRAVRRSPRAPRNSPGALAERLKAGDGASRRSSPAPATTALAPFPMRWRSPRARRPSGSRAGSSAALRIRTLHGTVLRRTHTLAARGELPPELPTTDPLDDATVLVAGRGRSYPALSVAVGERVGLVGALSVESAARALNARDIDGMVIGDGFGPRIVEALLTVLAEDVRFRDLPVAVLGGHPDVIEEFSRAFAQSRAHRRRPGAAGRALPAVRAPACLRRAAQAHAQIARRQGHDRSRHRAARP